MSETEPQLDAQVLHRVRDSLISQQTSQIRGILLERCIVVPHGRHNLLDILVALLLEQDHTRIADQHEPPRQIGPVPAAQ